MKKKYSHKLPEHYSSIDDLNMLAWDRIHKKFDMVNLLVKPSKLTEKQKEKLVSVWIKIYDEYISVFGFGEGLKQIVQKELTISKLKLKKVISGDDSIQNFIRAEEIKLDAIKMRLSGGGDVYKAKQQIEKHWGIRIILRETSVREFYSYMDDLKKKSK